MDRFPQIVIIFSMAKSSFRDWVVRLNSVSIVSYLLILTAVTACEKAGLPGEPDKVTRNGRIVFVAMPSPDPRWDSIEEGARGYLKNFPSVTLTVLHPADDSNAALLETCRSAMTSQPHAVCIWVNNSDAAPQAVEEVTKAGAAAITVGALPDSPLIFGHVQCSAVEAAELVGKKLDEWAGAQSSYVLLHNNGRTDGGTAIYQRFQREIIRHNRLKMLQDAAPRNEVAESVEALREMLRTFPNVGVAVTLDPRIWWTDRGEILGPETRMATIGAPPQVWPLISKGKGAAAGWIDRAAGKAAMEFAVQSLADHRRTNRISMIQPEWVTKENIDDFSKRYRQE